VVSARKKVGSAHVEIPKVCFKMGERKERRAPRGYMTPKYTTR
jgi:hypothetical protein